MTGTRLLLGHHVRPAVVALAFVVLGAAVALTLTTTAPLWLVPATLLAPDLAFLVGVGQHREHGAMPRRAVPFHNAAHHPVVALVAVVVGVVVQSPVATTLALVWLSHIVWDRGVGYGLRDRAGRPRHAVATTRHAG